MKKIIFSLRIFTSVLCVCVLITNSFMFSFASEDEKVVYQYFITTNDEVCAYQGIVFFPQNVLSVSKVDFEDKEVVYYIRNGKILFNLTQDTDSFDYTEKKMLVSVEFDVLSEYSPNDIYTDLSQIYSMDQWENEENTVFRYENIVNKTITKSGLKDLDNPQNSYIETAETRFKFGDVDQNGTVNIKDVSLIMKSLLGIKTITEKQKEISDINTDNKFTIRDATYLQMILASLLENDGQVLVNHYIVNQNGERVSISNEQVITGQPGDKYETYQMNRLGYMLDETRIPEVSAGRIPYSGTRNVDYYYIQRDNKPTFHIKLPDNETRSLYAYVWNTKTYSAQWPGNALNQVDDNDWLTCSVDCENDNTYNLILSYQGNPQTQNYENLNYQDLWIYVEEDTTNNKLVSRIYSANPELYSNAPLATYNG